MSSFIKILLFFIIFSAENLFAQEESAKKDSLATDEIIISANRIRMSMLFAPNKIQVIDEKQIGSLNGGRLADVLKFSDAVFVKDYGFNSGLKTISLNSTQSEQALILVDGVKLNGQDNAQYDIGLLQVQDISRIEISNGGSSALFGSEAIGGVINIITKKYELTKPFGLELKGMYASYGIKGLYLKALQQIKKNGRDFINFDAAYSYESGKNNYEYHFFNGLTTLLKERQNSDYINHFFNFNFNIRTDNKSGFRVLANYNYWNRGIPGVELGYTPGTSKQIDRDAIASVIYNRILSKKLELKSNFDFKYSLRSYYDTATFNLTAPINSFYKSISYINGTTLNFIPSKKSELDFGYEASYNTIASDQLEKGNLVHGGIFTAYKYGIDNTFLSKITLYPSARYDYFSNIDEKNVLTGKLGINLKPFEKTDFTIKSSFGNNFRAPAFNDLYWKDLGNKNLKPEKSVSFDAGLFYSFSIFVKNEIEFSYFNINTTDRILWTPGQDNIWRPVNIGRVKSEGIDLSLKTLFDVSKSFNTALHVNYNYAAATKKNEDFPGDPSYNKQILYIPQEFFKSSVMFNYLTSSKIIKFVSLNAFYTYTGRRYMNTDNTVFAPHYMLVDANIGIGFNLFKTGTELKFIANNIFNEDYRVVSGYPMPLRNYKLQISFKY